MLTMFVASTSQAQSETIGASVTAVGHYGKGIGVPDFFVNGQWGGAVKGWGGGGGNVCCVNFKRIPNEPVMATVKWRTYRSNVEESLWHEQTVVVHFAENRRGYFYVHFLPGHRVEVWSSARLAPESVDYAGPAYPRGPAPDYAPLPGEKPNPPTEIKP